MPPINFKADFAAEAARFYTTFPQPENSRRIIARNNRNLVTIAEHVADKISSQSVQKARQSLLGASFSRIA